MEILKQQKTFAFLASDSEKKTTNSSEKVDMQTSWKAGSKSEKRNWG